ncbi:hypothetical protein Q8A67_012660 [Cirrhinus molitorella]|uniref:Ig-like domain-containing protein n=1 Tax=Cirrhinus molitorella TaxID=172907 RepID=A0AA88PYS4_9TELE|nr:hypothetical protein Q8A67_012660 [Cirrhinus molitorella]
MDIWTAEKIIIFSFLLKGVCCRDFSVSLPEKIEALSGSCVIISCTFEIQENYDPYLTERATGVWLKDGMHVNNNQVFNSRDPGYMFSGRITGELHKKNCTTVFYNIAPNHNGQYYFRIEGHGILIWTYNKTSTINVIGSPPKPTVQLYVEQKEVQDQEEVLEGSSVSLRCSAESLCSSPPPTLTWSSTPRIPLSDSSRLQKLILISDLNFTATHHQHGVTFTCTITYQLQDKNKTAQNSITLYVQYAPKISSSSSCIRAVVPVCFCEVDGNPSPELEWHLSGRPVTNSSNTFISEERLSITGLRSSITLHQSLTNTSTLQCISKNTHGTARKLLQLPLFYLQFLDCQQTTVSLLIILALILVLYALTVGLGLYKMRQLSTKLKAQNEAADTHASLQLSTLPSEYETLNIKRGVCCKDFSISLPNKIQALSGSCVIIECRFEIHDAYDKNLTETATTGLWMKDGIDINKHKVFTSRDPKPDHFSGKITGKLHEKNCTTVFYNVTSKHNGQYYFRIMISERMKYTYGTNSSTINVIELAPKPTVQLYVERKEVQDLEEVLEGSSVSLRCSAETLCSSPPPTLTWSSTPRIPLSDSSRLQELILISDLNFTATRRQHRVTFTCTITYQLQDKNKTAHNNIDLHVQYAPKISNSSSCIRTDVTVCFCEVDGNPSSKLEWHLSGRSVTNSSNTFISEERLSSTGLRSSITLHQSLTHTSTLQCVSNNSHGNTSQLFQLPSSVALSVNEEMDTAENIILFCFLLKGVCCRSFSISLPNKIEALSGSCVIIECRFEIEDKYDKNFTETADTGLWLKDGTEENTHKVFTSRDPKPNHFNGKITGKLHEKNCTTVFYNVTSKHNGQYYFRITSGEDLKYTYRNSSTINVTESAPKPTVQLYVEQKEVQDQEEVLEGSSVSLRCSAETLCSSSPPTLTWSSTPRIPLSDSSRLQELILISDLNFTATRRQHRVTFTCTITYQLQDKNKTAHNNISLRVQYAPKISNSSSCIGTNVIVCFCEVDGNPSPKLEWYLSGRPVTNSSNTFISEERLSSTDLRSSITLHQSLTHTSTLQCVSNNTHGTASQLIQLSSSVARLNLFSVLIGVAGVALVVVLLSAITCICVIPQENQDDPVSVVMSSAGAATANQESIIYSSVDFTNCKPREVVSGSSLHADYVVVQDCSGGLSKTESSMGESSRAIEAQVIVSADVLTKQTQSKQSEEEPFIDSSQLYAKVQRR